MPKFTIYKNKLIALCLAFLSLGYYASAQDDEFQEQDNKLNSWSVGLLGGATTPMHDVRKKDVFNETIGYQAGLHLTKYISPVFGIRAEFAYAQVDGELDEADEIARLGSPLLPTTGIESEVTMVNFSANLVVNLSNLSLGRPKNERMWGVYAYMGVGVSNFETTLKDKELGDDIDLGSDDWQTELLVPVGFIVKRKIMDNFDIGLEATLYNIASDEVEGIAFNGSDQGGIGRVKDSYLAVSFSFNYHFSWKDNDPYRSHTQWVNPLGNNREKEFQARIQELEEQEAHLTEENKSLKTQIDTINSSLDALKKDDDNDGVSNFYDKEPNTGWDLTVITSDEVFRAAYTDQEFAALQEKAKKNVRIKTDGAGVSMDSDEDGIPDHLDKCASEKGTKEFGGCKPKVSQETVQLLKNLQSVQFASGSYQLDVADDSKYQLDMFNLDKLATYLSKYEVFLLRIEGHTDDVGAAAKNQVLSENRAKTIKSELVKRGIDTKRITAIGFGESRPKVKGKSKSARRANRRVEFILE